MSSRNFQGAVSAARPQALKKASTERRQLPDRPCIPLPMGPFGFRSGKADPGATRQRVAGVSRMEKPQGPGMPGPSLAARPNRISGPWRRGAQGNAGSKNAIICRSRKTKAEADALGPGKGGFITPERQDWHCARQPLRHRAPARQGPAGPWRPRARLPPHSRYMKRPADLGARQGLQHSATAPRTWDGQSNFVATSRCRTGPPYPKTFSF